MGSIDVADLAQAARVLVTAPVRDRPGARLVGDGDVFAIIADEQSETLATVLSSAAEGVGGVPTIYRLDLLTSASTNRSGRGRPHRVLPDAVRRGLMVAPCSAYLASAPIRERPMRQQILSIIDECELRHAHLPDITDVGFARGLATDQSAVVAAGKGLLARLSGVRSLSCESPGGTSLRVELEAQPRWTERLGEIVQGKSTSFPAGALFASPEDVLGTFVADASIGEFFGAREGVLRHKPVRLTIEGGRVTRVEAPECEELAVNIRAMLKLGANSDRVGVVCLGVHEGIREPTGIAAIDQNLVALHLLIGDPAARDTGATWSARSSFAVCQAQGRVLAGGRALIDEGKLTR